MERDGENDPKGVPGGAFHQDRDRKEAGSRGRLQDGKFSFRPLGFERSVYDIRM